MTRARPPRYASTRPECFLGQSSGSQASEWPEHVSVPSRTGKQSAERSTAFWLKPLRNSASTWTTREAPKRLRNLPGRQSRSLSQRLRAFRRTKFLATQPAVLNPCASSTSAELRNHQPSVCRIPIKDVRSLLPRDALSPQASFRN